VARGRWIGEWRGFCPRCGAHVTVTAVWDESYVKDYEDEIGQRWSVYRAKARCPNCGAVLTVERHIKWGSFP